MGGEAELRGRKRLVVQEMEHEFWLADIHDLCIIGLDLLIRWGGRVDVSGAAITLGVETVALQFGEGHGAYRRTGLVQPATHTGSARPTHLAKRQESEDRVRKMAAVRVQKGPTQ
ncbi:unnamed protein product, partial [Lota lota]